MASPKNFAIEPIFRVIKEKQIVMNGIDILINTFMLRCPVVAGIPLNKQDLQFLFESTAQISMSEDMALGVFDHNDCDKVKSIILSTSYEGKKIQAKEFISHNWEKPETIKVLNDLFDKIHYPIEIYPNPAYLFAIGVDPLAVGRGLGNFILINSLNYWKNKGYKSMFAEATSSKSRKLFMKHGAEIMKQYPYEDYTKETKFQFLPIAKDESFTHVRILF